MEDVVIWHNPRCSKSRRTLELLRAHGVEPAIVRYLDTPPTRDELDRVLRCLGMEPRDLMRKNEYKDQGLDDPSLTRREMIDAMVKYPMLIERPVVVCGERAILGRPPENVLSLLQSLG
jgi:arsenate reductase